MRARLNPSHTQVFRSLSAELEVLEQLQEDVELLELEDAERDGTERDR